MIKYLFFRFILILFFLFFKSWAFNIDTQFFQFFNIDLTNGFLSKVLSWILLIIILFFGFIFLNISYSLISFLINDSKYKDELRLLINEKNIFKFIKLYIFKSFQVISLNIDYEMNAKMDTILLLMIVFIYLPLSFVIPKGNLLFYNYIGIYKNYEIETQTRFGDEANYVEVKNYIIHKSKKNVIRRITNNIEKNRELYEDYFEVEGKKYLFIQAGLIDGFKTYNYEYKGIVAYIECVCFLFFELMISTLIFYILPFSIILLILIYKNEEIK